MTLEVSFMLLELSVMLHENSYSSCVTHDDCHVTIKMFLWYRPLKLIFTKYFKFLANAISIGGPYHDVDRGFLINLLVVKTLHLLKIDCKFIQRISVNNNKTQTFEKSGK